jgi:hypothetical protein
LSIREDVFETLYAFGGNDGNDGFPPIGERAVVDGHSRILAVITREGNDGNATLLALALREPLLFVQRLKTGVLFAVKDVFLEEEEDVVGNGGHGETELREVPENGLPVVCEGNGCQFQRKFCSLLTEVVGNEQHLQESVDSARDVHIDHPNTPSARRLPLVVEVRLKRGVIYSRIPFPFLPFLTCGKYLTEVTTSLTYEK